MSKKIIIVKPEGVEVVGIDNDQMYKQFSLICGGMLENVSSGFLSKPFRMICNEEGLILGLPLNAAASVLYGTGQPIAGTCIICKEEMTEEGPDWAGLDEDEIITLLFYLRDILTVAKSLTEKGGK